MTATYFDQISTPPGIATPSSLDVLADAALFETQMRALRSCSGMSRGHGFVNATHSTYNAGGPPSISPARVLDFSHVADARHDTSLPPPPDPDTSSFNGAANVGAVSMLAAASASFPHVDDESFPTSPFAPFVQLAAAHAFDAVAPASLSNLATIRLPIGTSQFALPVAGKRRTVRGTGASAGFPTVKVRSIER